MSKKQRIAALERRVAELEAEIQWLRVLAEARSLVSVIPVPSWYPIEPYQPWKSPVWADNGTITVNGVPILTS